MTKFTGRRQLFGASTFRIVAAVAFAVTAAMAGSPVLSNGRRPELQGIELTKAGEDGKIRVRSKKLATNRAFYVPASAGAGTPALLQVHLSNGSTVTVALRMLQKIPNDKGPWENIDVRSTDRPWGSYQIIHENGVVTGTITVCFDKTYYDGSWRYQVRNHKLAALEIALDSSDEGSDLNRQIRLGKVEQTVRQLVNWMVTDYGSREPGDLQANAAIENPETRAGDYRTMAVMIDGRYVALVRAQQDDGSYRQADGLSLRMGLRNDPHSLERTPDNELIAGGTGVGTLATAAWSRVHSEIWGPDGSDPGGVCFKVSPNVEVERRAEITLSASCSFHVQLQRQSPAPALADGVPVVRGVSVAGPRHATRLPAP